jgi:WD40 repeat protein
LYAATRSAIRRWDVAAELELPRWRTISPGFLAVSADGRTLASTHPLSPLAKVNSFHVTLWDTATGEKKTHLKECAGFFDGVAFSPDGTRLAALGHQSLWLWELPSCRAICRRPSKKSYTGLAFSPDSQLLATSCNDGKVRFWDGQEAEPLKVFDWEIDKVLCVAFAPDGMRAAAGGALGNLVVWDVD